MGERAQQVLHPLNSVTQSHDHIITEFPTVAKLRNIVNKQAKLADRVFYVVDNEGKTLVEIFELARVSQGLGGFLLNQVAGQLQATRRIKFSSSQSKVFGARGLAKTTKPISSEP